MSAETTRPVRGGGGWSLSVRQLFLIVGLGGVASAVFAYFLDAVGRSQEAARASTCICNLCAIKIAMLNYHSTYGSFPPAYVADAEGRPMHSWRVLLLPYLEQASLYAKYNFDEPWNGPNNSRLASQMPNAYRCPNHVDAIGKYTTDYVVVSGPGTLFPGAETRKQDDVKDGLAKTVMVVEAARLKVPWMAPADLDVRWMSFKIDDPHRPSLGAFDRYGPAVATADGGAYHRLGRRTTSERFVKAIVTIDGDEPVDWADRR